MCILSDKLLSIITLLVRLDGYLDSVRLIIICQRKNFRWKQTWNSVQVFIKLAETGRWRFHRSILIYCCQKRETTSYCQNRLNVIWKSIVIIVSDCFVFGFFLCTLRCEHDIWTSRVIHLTVLNINLKIKKNILIQNRYLNMMTSLQHLIYIHNKI